MDFFAQFNFDTPYYRAMTEEMTAFGSSLRVKEVNDLFSASQKIMRSEGDNIHLRTGLIKGIKERKGEKGGSDENTTDAGIKRISSINLQLRRLSAVKS